MNIEGKVITQQELNFLSRLNYEGLHGTIPCVKCHHHYMLGTVFSIVEVVHIIAEPKIEAVFEVLQGCISYDTSGKDINYCLDLLLKLGVNPDLVIAIKGRDGNLYSLPLDSQY